jgi:hypothetical protein
MLESMGADDDIQELNPDGIDITKVPSLPSRLYSFLYDEESAQTS